MPRHFLVLIGAALLLFATAEFGNAQSLISLPAINGAVNDMVVSGNTLYLGGSFTTVGSSTRNGLAAIDLGTGTVTSWDPSAANAVTVNSLALGPAGQLYVGGVFSTIGEASRKNAAALSLTTGLASSWDAGIEDGFSGVRGLQVTGDGTAYLWGDFTSLQSTARASGLAAVNAAGSLTAFDPVVANPSGLFNNYRDMAISESNGKVFLAYGNSGATWNSGGTESRRGMVELAMTDGVATSFNLVPQDGALAGPGVTGLVVSGNSVFVGGPFNNVMSSEPNVAPGTPRQKLAKIDIPSGTLDAIFAPTVSTGPNDTVRHMSYVGGVLYAVGDFVSYGGEGRKGIAAIDPLTGNLITEWDVTTGESFERFSGTGARIAASESNVFLASANMSDWTVLGDPGQSYYVGVTAVPEPGSLGMIGFALSALAAVKLAARKRR